MQHGQLVGEILTWYARSRRDLPWRRAGTTPWAVMVSEFMLQQTPVNRVLTPWRAWLDRWPRPADLAADPPSEAIRAWGRLGYPRRAIRLHAAARAIVDQHGGMVPQDYDELRALPGVGDYTAAAIASFAFGQRQLVLDTNVRRVLARLDGGVAFPASSPTRAERAAALAWLPDSPLRASAWAAASMELGAVVCTARSPDCGQCPVQRACQWWRAGRPAHQGPPRRGQSYQGTDRQCRGVLLAAVRDSDDVMEIEDVLGTWPDRRQAERALESLVADALVVRGTDQTLGLPR